MRLTIKATNITHTNAIDTFLHKRMSELEHVLEQEEKSHIARLDVGKTSKHRKEGKDIFYAEITLHVKKKDFRAVAKSSDLYTAIDMMRDMIIRDVTRHHALSRVRMKKGGREIKKRVKENL